MELRAPPTFVLVVPGPVERELHVTSVAAFAELVTKDPAHPARRAIERVLSKRREFIYITVVPDKDWFPAGQLHPAVAREQSVPYVVEQIKAMTDDERREVVKALLGHLDELEEKRNPLRTFTVVGGRLEEDR